MGARFLSLVIFFAVGLTTALAAHRPPISHQEAMVHERIFSMLKLKETLSSAEGRPFKNVNHQHTMKTLAEGEWKGMRVAFDFSRLHDPQYVCQASTPSQKLSSLQGMADPATGEQHMPDMNNASEFYAPQKPHHIMVLDRDAPVANGTHHPTKNYTCQDRYVMCDKKKAFVRDQLMPRVRTMLNTYLAPKVAEAGDMPIQGNQLDGNQIQCSHPMYRWRVDIANFTAKDMVVFVTAEPDHVPFHSFPCLTASDGRPAAIVLNVAPSFLKKHRTQAGFKYLYNRAVQSVLKSLGLSADMLGLWKQPTTVQKTFLRGHSVHMLATPKVREWVETKHFNCQGNPLGGAGSIGGAELEDALDDSKIHFYWEKRIFRGEIMTMPSFSEETVDAPPPNVDEDLVISGLTLSALDDTGWFAVNHAMAQTLSWGRNQPCAWATDYCDQWGPRHYCFDTTPSPVQKCSPDFMSTSTCNGVQYSANSIPTHFQYQPNTHPDFGGRDKLMDYCPIQQRLHSCVIFNTNTNAPDCDKKECPKFDVRGPGSRCFMNTIRYTKFNSSVTPPSAHGACLRMECTGTGATRSLTVVVAGEKYECKTAGDIVGPSIRNPEGIATASGAKIIGTVVCPDPTTMCIEAGPEVYEKACDPMFDCSGHGTCDANGACQCFNQCGPDPNNCAAGSRGFFTGKRCTKCMEGYAPPDCVNRTCVRDPVTNMQCYGHGRCNGTGAVPICECDNNAERGHWDPATSCSTCLTGFAGDSCKRVACQTGTCGHGTCNLDTGMCVCDANEQSGYWEGAACDKCKMEYDFNTGCRKRFQNQCPACEPVISSAGAGVVSNGSVPSRPPPTDECGCQIDTAWPTVSSRKLRPQECGPCPQWEQIQIDCKGFPLMYETCWEPDDCGCTPRPRPSCKPGTDRVPSPASYPKATLGNVAVFKTASGFADNRVPPVPTVNETKCRCPAVDYVPSFDCLGALDPVTGAPSNPNLVVWFEPMQLFEEDFCHCVSPPIPQCTPSTKPQNRNETAHGAHFDCNKISSCPDWNTILNVGQLARPNEPDLSVVDCDGFPAPKLEAAEDKCGCQFPTFRCKPSTEGICAPDSCPVWDELTINCQGGPPPTINWHGPHPCGCEPPRSIVCEVNSGPVCDCAVPERPIQYVDCKGQPLKQPRWNPYIVYPNGDPYIMPCDPCPHCPNPPPVRQCIPGTDKPLEKSDNPVTSCPDGPIAPFPDCPSYPPPCPVDCGGVPTPPPASFDPSCECPPPPQPTCIDGTDGTVGDTTMRAGTCGSTPSMCHPYICGDAASAPLLESRGPVDKCEDRQKEAMQHLPPDQPTYCVQEGSCFSDNDCVCGFKCGPCGMCIPEGLVVSGCLLDPAMCGDYACQPACTAEGIQDIKNGNVVGVCVPDGQCTSDQDCQGGAVCSKPTYAQDPSAGAIANGEGQVIGDTNTQEGAEPVDLDGTPGIDPTATGVPTSMTEEPTPFVPKKQTGRCVIPVDPEPQAVQYCFNHDECNGFVCGLDNKQTFFANSRCRASCAYNAHCHPSHKCDIKSGRCINMKDSPAPLPEGVVIRSEGGCESKPFTHCMPYVCGSELGAAPLPGAKCRKSCTTNAHCAPGFTCEEPSEEDIKENIAIQGAAGAQRVMHMLSRRVQAHVKRYMRRYKKLSELSVNVGNAGDGSVDVGSTTTEKQVPPANSKAMGTAPAEELLGKCVPKEGLKTGDIPESVKSEMSKNPFVADKKNFKTRPGQKPPMLKMPIAHLDVDAIQRKLEEDPFSTILTIAPFPPPTPEIPKPPGTYIGGSTASCRPYKGAMRGATAGQVSNQEQAAEIANANGEPASLPGCKSSCQSDNDCVGGYFCVQPAPVQVDTNEAGVKVYDKPECNDPEGKGCTGDLTAKTDTALPPAADTDEIPLTRREQLKNTCQKKRSLGTVCMQDKECGSGHCVGGICCNTACSSPCQTCLNMGVCSWVAPHTDPLNQCTSCQWCDYVPEEGESVAPFTKLGCVFIPEGKDPNDNCGGHGTCNGQGSCKSNPGWGGPNANTCAGDRQGPNCDEDVNNYRVLELDSDYQTCTPDQVAADAGAPSTDPTTVARTGSAFKRRHEALAAHSVFHVRTAKGLQEQSLPTTYKRRTQVVDRRPRQFASRVLGLSGHSQFPCKNILHEPLPPAQRTHKEGAKSWAPLQYYKKDGKELNPDLRYFPWVNCLRFDTNMTCSAQLGCKYVNGVDHSYCTGDGSVVTEADAKRVLGIEPRKQIPGTQKFEFDETLMTKPVYQWIELEFPDAVYIEGVQLFENFHPGSLVMIESQPALKGSAALADVGGGSPATDATGAQQPQEVPHTPRQHGNPRAAVRCASHTPFGKQRCLMHTKCVWASDLRCHPGSNNATICPPAEAGCDTTPGCTWDGSACVLIGNNSTGMSELPNGTDTTIPGGTATIPGGTTATTVGTGTTIPGGTATTVGTGTTATTVGTGTTATTVGTTAPGSTTATTAAVRRLLEVGDDEPAVAIKTRFVGSFNHHKKTRTMRKGDYASVEAHDHQYGRTFRQLQGDTGSSSGGVTTPESLAQPFCDIDSTWIYGENEERRTPEGCRSRTQSTCNLGCTWRNNTSISSDTPLPPPTEGTGEGGSYPSNPPKSFTIDQAGPAPPEQNIDVNDIPPSDGNVPCQAILPGESLNKNTQQFQRIWERKNPNFPASPKYRNNVIDVGYQPYRSKVIRLTFAPTSPKLSQIDAVAIIGASKQKDPFSNETLCPGEIWKSPVPEGTPSTAGVTDGKMVLAPCNGNGKCGVHGCECRGNFAGKGCETCKLGFTGPACETPIILGCKRSFYENLVQLGDDVINRWKYTDMKNLSSDAVDMKYFGSSMVSPEFNLGGEHTHVQVTASMLVVDVPQGDDLGIYLTFSKNHAGHNMELIKVEKPNFFSGLNLIGTENGDYQADMKVKVPWKHTGLVVNLTLWWGGGNTEDFVMSLSTLEVETCKEPDVEG